ncbi:MAG: polyhydroxyalkanoic acid synthase subunit PhaR [Dehalococcoidia bacterium]|nr:MAG: polyhydroxyalkanoic acid synthase subunit PhaR [Dehalococcoidia bacterium]
MADNPNSPKDPMQAWREMRDAATEQWAKAMAEFVGTESFARSMGAYIDAYLATAAPYQKAISEYMEAMLTRLNMPTREDVIGLARRLTNVETRLDDLDARLDEIDSRFADLSTKLDLVLRAVQASGAAATEMDQPQNRPPRRNAKGTHS